MRLNCGINFCLPDCWSICLKRQGPLKLSDLLEIREPLYSCVEKFRKSLDFSKNFGYKIILDRQKFDDMLLYNACLFKA